MKFNSKSTFNVQVLSGIKHWHNFNHQRVTYSSEKKKKRPNIHVQSVGLRNNNVNETLKHFFKV